MGGVASSVRPIVVLGRGRAVASPLVRKPKAPVEFHHANVGGQLPAGSPPLPLTPLHPRKAGKPGAMGTRELRQISFGALGRRRPRFRGGDACPANRLPWRRTLHAHSRCLAVLEVLANSGSHSPALRDSLVFRPVSGRARSGPAGAPGTPEPVSAWSALWRC